MTDPFVAPGTVTEPTFTRHDDGTITVQWPDPPRPWYQVAHEVIAQWVDDKNELNQLRGLVRRFTDWSDPCRYDHDGYCQTHNLDEHECPHDIAQQLIVEWDRS